MKVITYEEIEDSVLIREDDGDWKEPLVEV